MSRYYRRRGTLEAVQFRGDENTEEVRELCGARVYKSSKRKGCVILIGSEEFPLRYGDYIVFENDEYKVWNEDIFETFYEEARTKRS